MAGYRVRKPVRELAFSTGPLAGRHLAVPEGFVLSVEEAKAWPERAFRVAQGPDGYLDFTDAQPTDPQVLVAAAGASVGVEGDGGAATAVPATSELAPDGEQFPQHVGHGKYVLSDGSEVHGRAKAMAAEAALAG